MIFWHSVESMSSNRNLKVFPAALAGFVLISTTACGATEVVSDAQDLLPSGIPTSISSSTLESITDFSPSEVMFLQMMIPHHEQAIEISKLAQTQTQNPAILDLATRISGAQQPEIDQMKKLLTDASLPLMMDHNMGMSGMLPQSELDKLSALKDSAFDKLFLTAMILHHEGAIAMTEPVLDSANPEVKALAEKIIADQKSEVAEMKELLATS